MSETPRERCAICGREADVGLRGLPVFLTPVDTAAGPKQTCGLGCAIEALARWGAPTAETMP